MGGNNSKERNPRGTDQALASRCGSRDEPCGQRAMGYVELTTEVGGLAAGVFVSHNHCRT
jgi:hypothetical protein